MAPPQAPEPITESKPSGRPRKAGGLFYSNAEIAEIATSGKALPPEIKAWAKEIGWDKFNAIVEKGSGSLALSDDAPKINCSFTNVESDPRDDDGTAIAQMIEINDLLDTVRADDPDDMSLVDRVKGLIEAKTPVERSQLSAAIDAELLVPAPVMADLLGMFMRNLGDPRYQQISGTRIAGGHRWETAYREGLFVGEVTRNWTLIGEAQSDMATINTRIAAASRAVESTLIKYQNSDRRYRAEVERLGGKQRVTSHVEETVGKGKSRKTVMKPVVTHIEPSGPERGSLEEMKQKTATTLSDHRTAKKLLESLEARLLECRKIIEDGVPEPFTFSIADIESGKVRIAAKW